MTIPGKFNSEIEEHTYIRRFKKSWEKRFRPTRMLEIYEGVDLAKQLSKLNFKLCGTGGTAEYINKHGIKCKKINKVNQGSPHIVDVLNAKKIALVINTGGGNSEKQLNDALALRRATLANKVPYCTNMSTAKVCIEGIKSLKNKEIKVTSLQDI